MTPFVAVPSLLPVQQAVQLVQQADGEPDRARRVELLSKARAFVEVGRTMVVAMCDRLVSKALAGGDVTCAHDVDVNEQISAEGRAFLAEVEGTLSAFDAEIVVAIVRNSGTS